MEQRIGPIDCNHVDAVASIAHDSFPSRWSEQDFAYFLGHANRLCLGLFLDDKLVAYVLALCVCGELDIISVATAVGYRRRGLGAKILQAALLSAGVLRAHLEVDVRNEGAIALYRRCGFQEVGIRKLYYDGKSDALLMSFPGQAPS